MACIVFTAYTLSGCNVLLVSESGQQTAINIMGATVDDLYDYQGNIIGFKITSWFGNQVVYISNLSLITKSEVLSLITTCHSSILTSPDLITGMTHYWNLDAKVFSVVDSVDVGDYYQIEEFGTGLALSSGTGPGGRDCLISDPAATANHIRGNQNFKSFDSYGVNDAFSFSYWFKLYSYSASVQSLMQAWVPIANRSIFFASIRGSGDGSIIRLTVYDNLNVGTSINDPTTVTLNNWTHVTGTYDGADMALYVNSALINSIPGPSPPLATNLISLNFHRTYTNATWFDGEICLPGLWNRALNQSEVNHLYNSGNGRSYSEM